MAKYLAALYVAILTIMLAACTTNIEVIPATESIPVANTQAVDAVVDSTPTPDATLAPPRVLSVCMGQEPESLFLFGDMSVAATQIRQAIYDGPFDWGHDEASPVILKKIPSVQDGDVQFLPVEVAPGTLIFDAYGQWVSLNPEVTYLPSGCQSLECARVYEGQAPVQIDQMVVQFEFLPDLRWADGHPLSAQDSVYAFSVYQHLFGQRNPERTRYTQLYQAINDLKIQWNSIPGYRGEFLSKFFAPFPQHLWEPIAPLDLFSHDLASKTPLGWGPYQIDEWITGDHITLSRNPNYAKATAGQPYFDHLVFRFVGSGETAIEALTIGECDIIDETTLQLEDILRLDALQAEGLLSYSVQPGASWELAAFGIDTLSVKRYDLFGQQAVRQAIAHCIDRDQIIAEILFDQTQIPASYIMPGHSLENPDALTYNYSLEKAADLFAAAGWVDFDADPKTPLTASGISGIPDGTELMFEYLVPDDPQRVAVAEMVVDSLNQCGVGATLVQKTWDELFAPGPEGLAFGRQFDMVQFAWATAVDPACHLFISAEIPGDFPAYAKGWGGSNLSGYQNERFDQLCRQAQFAIPGSSAYQAAHAEAQMVFSADLPVIPLFQQVRIIATRPDFCGIPEDVSSIFAFIEQFNLGEACQ